MVAPTPNGLRVTEPVNPYSSPVVEIAIGNQKQYFSVHKAKLEQRTSFFNIHGGPPDTSSLTNSAVSAAPSEIGSDGVFVPEAVDLDITTKYEDETSAATGATMPGNEPKFDFTIVDRFHTPGAFKILVDWLYNEPPTTPSSKIHCKHLLQAYILARMYTAYPLQNLIVDRFRNFHETFGVELDNLIWLVNRIGDNTECPLTAYFVEQTAFEIADGGFEGFERSNLFFKTFLEQGEWKIRLEVVKALAKHAHTSGVRLVDPAKDLTQDWHVEETGDNAGGLKMSARKAVSTRSARPRRGESLDD